MCTIAVTLFPLSQQNITYIYSPRKHVRALNESGTSQVCIIISETLVYYISTFLVEILILYPFIYPSNPHSPTPHQATIPIHPLSPIDNNKKVPVTN